MTFKPYPKTPPRPKKPRQPLKRTPIKKKYKPTGEGQVFADIWKERPHNCSWCHIYLGEEMKAIFFDHIIPKSKAPALRLEKTNIRLLCERGHYLRHNGTKAEILQHMKIKL